MSTKVVNIGLQETGHRCYVASKKRHSLVMMVPYYLKVYCSTASVLRLTKHPCWELAELRHICLIDATGCIQAKGEQIDHSLHVVRPQLQSAAFCRSPLLFHGAAQERWL